MSAIDIWWQVTPFFRVGLKVEDIPAYLLDFGAFAGIGGLWTALFMGQLVNFAKDNALMPLHDTRLIDDKLAMEMEAHHA